MSHIVVCGGRTFADRDLLFSVLDEEFRFNTFGMVMEGGAKGADALARAWAMERKVQYCTVPAMWEQFGRLAGPMRNQQMAWTRPLAVICFPGGRGTANMQETAMRHHIRVRVVPPAEAP